MLNGEQLIPYISDPLGLGKIEQSGYDLTVKEIKALDLRDKGYWQVGGKVHQPVILRDRTIIPEGFYCPLKETDMFIEGVMKKGWVLESGFYSITFDQGIKLGGGVTGIVVHRSSVARVGGEISAGVYDPGFQTENIGAILTLGRSVFIEKHSSLAKIIMYTHDELPPELLYKGQYSKHDPK